MDTIYTHARWRVQPGKREEFVSHWTGELATVFRSLPAPPRHGTLIQSLEDEDLFYSFGPWDSLEDVRAMRADAKAGEALDRLRALCIEAEPSAYRVVAEA